RFDWKKQIFELKRETAMDLMARTSGSLYFPFIIKTSDKIIYEGYFMSCSSSFFSNKPTIYFDRWDKKVVPPMYKISGGYPTDKYNPLMHEILKNNGKIKNISEKDYSLPLKYEFIGWHGERGVFQIALVIFTETLKIGRKAVFHLHISKGPKFRLSPDRLELQVKLITDNGKCSSIKSNYILILLIYLQKAYAGLKIYMSRPL
ncbi:unnamed protein product, partial [marine sediment metagenome]